MARLARFTCRIAKRSSCFGEIIPQLHRAVVEGAYSVFAQRFTTSSKILGQISTPTEVKLKRASSNFGQIR